ncbi:MAG: V-type ATPase subunit [Clostridia bacterium]|nr:V-type ATPase subunit [Clostridia bacterium]
MPRIKDTDYLCLSAMLRAKEANMISAEAFARMADAETVLAAEKMAEEHGYEGLDTSTPQTLDESLSRVREAVYADISELVPQKELLDLFRLKYDYHNAKVLVKSAAKAQEGAEAQGDPLLSTQGRLTPQEIRELFADENASGALKDAMTEASQVLARTENPQLADFGLDQAYFAEMKACAKALGGSAERYMSLLTDCANLNAYVRSVRMGKSADFLKFALSDGGSVDKDMLLAQWPEADVANLYAGSSLQEAARFAGEAMQGWKITPFELACDNALTGLLSDMRYTAFGPEAVVSYLASLDTEIRNLRMVLTGKICGIPADAIRERLRDVNV